MGAGTKILAGCGCLAIATAVAVLAALGLGLFWIKDQAVDMASSLEGLTSRTDEIDSLGASSSDELLRDRLIKPTLVVVGGGRCRHHHIIICHCLSFRPNHHGSAFQARPVPPFI